jgi:hypothetical protein
MDINSCLASSFGDSTHSMHWHDEKNSSILLCNLINVIARIGVDGMTSTLSQLMLKWCEEVKAIEQTLGENFAFRGIR